VVLATKVPVRSGSVRATPSALQQDRGLPVWGVGRQLGVRGAASTRSASRASDWDPVPASARWTWSHRTADHALPYAFCRKWHIA
jgi:hypothetical protein